MCPEASTTADVVESRHTVPTSIGDLNVWEWAPARGVVRGTVLFWHGAGAHSGLNAVEMARPLAERGLRTVAPDAPGFGGSAAGARDVYRTPALASAAAEVVEAVGADRVVFVGHSWGAYVGLQLARDAAERTAGVVLLDGGYRDRPTLPLDRWLADAVAMREQFRFHDIEEMVAHERADARRWSSEYERACRWAWIDDGRGVVMKTPPEAAAYLRAGFDGLTVEGLLHAVADRGVPVLLLVPEESLTADPETAPALARFEACLPSAAVRFLGDCGHFMVDDLGPALGTPIGEWIDGHALVGPGVAAALR